jgi:hypothetical protein
MGDPMAAKDLIGINLKKRQLGVEEGETRASLRPNSSTPWPPNHPTDQINLPQIVYTRKFATKLSCPLGHHESCKSNLQGSRIGPIIRIAQVHDRIF